ncbi:MAG TPA: hypothetical protein VGJ00_06560 [Rhabdochlamydiaceae bacterium]|jgi:hypothetical protein
MRLAILLVFLLFSCSRQSNWSHERIYSNYSEFSYGKVAHYAKNPIHELDLEFVRTAEQIKAYIVVHSICPSCASKKMPVRIEIEGTTTICDADQLDGGQRLILPESTANMLIEAFGDKKTVNISIPGYRSSIEGEDFEKQFGKMQRSSLENPFRLPF